MSGPPPPPPAGFPIAGQAFLPPLAPGWTEHRGKKSPGGQPYWFNPATNVSTYTRPLPPPPPGFPIAGAPPPPPAGFPLAQQPPSQFAAPLHFTPTNGAQEKAKKEKKEKPKEKLPMEGTSWIRVTTNKGNVFYNNKDTKESLWTVPEDIKEQVEALEKKEQEDRENPDLEEKKREEEERIVARKRKADDDSGNGANGKQKETNAEREEQIDEAENREDEQEKGDLDIEIEGAVEGASSAVPTELKPESATPPAPSRDEPPKKKKTKTRVVSSIEELETEDWQRHMAEQMAKEAEEAEAREKKEMEEAMKPDVVVKESEKVEKLEVNQVEAAALYKVLLEEKDVNPMAPFENELPKFVNDSRYHAVKTQRDRRDIFDEFCKDKIRERRAAKARLAQSGIKVDPLVAFRALLAATVTSTRTHFSDFKKAHGKDARFREFGKTEGEREREFKKYLRDLGEKKREAAEKADKEFKEMLREDIAIRSGDQWADVKKRHASDPRYAAVNSSSLREQLFTKHLASLDSSYRSAPTTSTSSSSATSSKPATTTKEDRAARAAASLREREEQVRLEKSKSERSANQARGHLGKEEAEREFGQLLIDAVRDHTARFEDVSSSLSQDPRFDHPSLTPRDKRQLFDSHISSLHRKRVAAVESLFLEYSPALDTPFHDVLPQISTSPHVTRLFGDNFNKLEDLYHSWQSRRAVQAKEEFYQLLRESPILEHWGRLRKMEKRDDVKLIGEEGTRNDESDDEETGVREMADQIDLKAVHATLKNDKRYLMFSHQPEKRERWIEDYVENKLKAPKTTVHQRD